MFNPIISLEVKQFAHFSNYTFLLGFLLYPPQISNLIWFVINKAKTFDLQFCGIPKLVSLAVAIAFPTQQLLLGSMLN